ncbi:hypothetical protein GEV33_011574 [Tenebrio molitor]|uniref:Uncharacterized protein n=1 Tax=Tenebrio molitor TaxID=7067 RepID=A0A8J6HCJ2_TENMO|nr:hypothetical protein GEV33_011574 [Tenebrio molitor]
MLWTFVFYRGTQAHLARKSQIVSLLGRVAVKEPDALGDIDLYLHSKDDRCDYYISGAVPLLYNDPMAAERDPDDLPDECRSERPPLGRIAPATGPSRLGGKGETKD